MHTESSVSMTELARLAGVTRTTVSLALRGNPRISKATRERIQTLAHEAGYQPDAEVSRVMSSLRRGGRAPQTLVWVTDHSPCPKLCEALYAASGRLGYRLDAIRVDSPPILPARLAGILNTRGTNGVLLSLVRKPDYVAGMDLSPFSVCSLGGHTEGLHTVELIPEAPAWCAEEALLLLDQLLRLNQRGFPERPKRVTLRNPLRGVPLEQAEAGDA
ncbi:MAG: LacI family DNA-binding transcriptional regulator [Verrucomicrobia bacterium]|nr:LacI family DNA-binding transcriptional regulator [Verrucomicrobiota bacterium]MCH8526163.1 LacI family DNA-binding transcriptional regulator [Kiritimatiellia bacterium]